METSEAAAAAGPVVVDGRGPATWGGCDVIPLLSPAEHVRH